DADGSESTRAASRTETEPPVQAKATPAELDGLPVRVRQANLAPQLLEQSIPAIGDEPAAPSPEAARSTMAALQLGWQRGRSVTDDGDGELPTRAKAEPARPNAKQASPDPQQASPDPQQEGDDPPDEGGS